MRRALLLGAPVAAAGSAAAFALHRVARAPFAPYGDFGAAHLEHQVRLSTAFTWAETHGSWWDRLLAVDGQYPPLLHVATLPLSRITGFEVQDIAWTGLLWLLLLAAAVGAAARTITGRWDAASAAATLTLLWPVGPAVATRYYYDLPLAAVLWTAAALVLATADGATPLDARLRGVPRALAQLGAAAAAGTLVGILAALACGFKWTALAFGPILVGAAILCPVHREGRRRWRLPARTLALAAAAGAGTAILWWVAARLDHQSSLATTFNDMWPGVGSALYRDDGSFHPTGALAALRAGEGADDRLLRPGVVFYPLTLVTAVLGPAFAAALSGPLWAWLRRDRRGAPFVAGVVGGQYLFLALVVSALDERFLLALAPGVLLAAAIGWTSLPPRLQRAWAAAAVASALFVSADFHYGRDLPWSAPAELPLPDGGSVVARGLGLGDSWEHRGWARWDSQLPPRLQARRMLWALMHQCGFGPAALRDAPGASTPLGERHWIEYRSLLASLGAAPPDPTIDDCEPWTSALAGLDRGDVVDRGLLQRAAVEVLDGSPTDHRVEARGCVDDAFPAGRPQTLGSAALLELERSGPPCLRVFEAR